MVMALGGGLMWFGWNELESQVTAALQENPVIEKRLGQIQKIEIRFTETGELPDDVFSYRVTGSLASGTVHIRADDVDGTAERLVEGTLFLDSGEELDLVSEQPAQALPAELGQPQEDTRAVEPSR